MFCPFTLDAAMGARAGHQAPVRFASAAAAVLVYRR